MFSVNCKLPTKKSNKLWTMDCGLWTKMGFTLIEMMIVVAILGMLFGMAIFAGNKARLQSKVSKTKADIAALEIAISMYEVDMGSYPASGNSNLVTHLIVDQAGDWHGPYIEFDEEDISGGAFQDPWNNDYVYTNHGTHNPSYDIYSMGPDESTSTGGDDPDDINNW